MKQRPFFKQILILTSLIAGFTLIPIKAQQPAFPGAEGYGKFASGGRGGRIIEVTTLEDRDRYGNIVPGSFRAALNTGGDDPITIVFRVSGIIELNGELKAKRSNMTIAGQTSPGDGICIKDASIKISGENIIIRYIRFRPGDETKEQVSCLNIENSKNIIVDHCSMSWSIEENMGFYDNHYTTVQYCILSESLYDSYHSKGPRGYAAQWGGQYASYHHNLIASHKSRSPRVNGCRAHDTIALCDFRNNVIFNFAKSSSIYGGEVEIFWDKDSNGVNDAGCFTNFVNNYIKQGPSYTGYIFATPSAGIPEYGYGQWFIDGNVMEGHEDVTANNWLGVSFSNVGNITNIKVDTEHEVDSVTTHSAQEAYNIVLNNAGAIKPIRDEVDLRIIGQIRGDSSIIGNGIIDSQAEVGGWPDYNMPAEEDIPVDTDKDGMPDSWETENELNPNDPEDGKIIAADGYSNLEHYLNSDIAYIPPALPSGVKQHEGNKLAVFPNPVGNMLYINENFEVSGIEIVSMDGKILLKRNLTNTEKSISLDNLNPGVYIINLEVKGQTISQKIYKQ